MNIAKTIIRNLSWLAGAEVFAKVIGFVLVILVSRYLGTVGYGQYTFANSFVLFFAFLADFGFGPYLTREIAKKPEETHRLVNEMFGAKILFVGLAFILILLSLPFLGKSPLIMGLVVLAGFNITLNSFQLFFKAVFQGHEQMRYEAISRFVEKTAWFVLTGLVLLFDLGIASLFIATALATTAKLLTSWRFLHQFFVTIKPTWNPRAWKTVIAESFYFTLINLFFIIYFKIDAVMLSYLKGDHETGLYGSAYDLIYALAFIPMFMATSVYPVLARFHENAREKLSEILPRVLKYFFLVALPIVVFLALFSDEIITIIYTPAFLPAIPMFRMLSLAFLFAFLNYPLNLFMGALHLQRISTVTTGAATILNVVLNLFFIPRYGGWGAALATLITEIVLLLLSLVIIEMNYHIFTRTITFRAARLFLALVASTSILFFRDHPMEQKLIVLGFFALGYIAFLLVFRILSEKDRQYASEFLSFRGSSSGQS